MTRAVPVVLLLALAAYLGLFCLPKRLPMTDEGMTVVLSNEILAGGAPYAEVESPYTPLAFYLHAGWMRLAGPGILAGRGVTILWALLAAALGAAAARAFLPAAPSWAAGLAVALSTFPYHCYASYNTVAMTIALASAAALLRGGVGWAGALAAAAFLTKQNLGGLALLGGGLAVLSADGVRPAARFCLGAALVAGAFAGFAHHRGYLDEMIAQAFTGGARQAGHVYAVARLDQLDRLRDLVRAPSPRALDAAAHSLSFVAAFLTAAALLPAAALLRRARDPRARAATLLCALTPLAGLGAAHNPTEWHIIFTRPVPILGAAFLLSLGRGAILRGAAVAAAAGFLLLHLGRQAMILDEYDSTLTGAPRAAGVRLRAWEAEVIQSGLDLLAKVPASDTVFVAAPDPLYYHLTDRRPPVRWIYLDPLLLSEKEVGEIRAQLAARGVTHVLYLSGRSAWYDYGRILERDVWTPVEIRRRGGIRIELLARRR